MMKILILSIVLISLAGAHTPRNRLTEKAFDAHLKNGLRRETKNLFESLILTDASGKINELVTFQTRAVFATHQIEPEVLGVKTDLHRHSIDFSLRAPFILLQGDYDTKGFAGFFEVKGHDIIFEGKALLNKQGGKYQVMGVSLKHKEKAVGHYFANLAMTTGNDLATAIFAEYMNQIDLHLAKGLTRQINELISTQEEIGRAEIGNANAYIDEVLILVREKIIAEGLDRIPLTNISIGFSQDVWLIGNVHGECGLYDGVLGGFETLHRIRDDATFDFNDPIITVNASVGINNGLLGYTISITFMDIGPQATLTGVLSYADIFFEAQILLEPLTVTITQFDIKDIGHIDITIEGLEPFNWLADIIVGTVINTVKGIVKEIIEGPIRRIIEWAINEYVHSILNPASSVAYEAIRLAL